MRIFIYFSIFFFITTCFLLWVLTFFLKDKKDESAKNEQLQNIANTTAEANKTKADARTGNHSTDIKYMADKLHDYAKK